MTKISLKIIIFLILISLSFVFKINLTMENSYIYLYTEYGFLLMCFVSFFIYLAVYFLNSIFSFLYLIKNKFSRFRK